MPELNGDGPVSMQIFCYLRQQIIQTSIAPDTALSEGGLCGFFGVSRQPVREALLRLSLAGLVNIFSQRGSIVSRISLTSVYRAQMIREAVEVEALRRALNGHGEALADQLKAELAIQKACQVHNQIERFYESDERFHRAIGDRSGIVGLASHIEEVRAPLDRVRNLDLRWANSLGELVEQHAAIADGIAAQDFGRAETALRLHLRRVLKGIPEQVAAMPDYFEDVIPHHAKA